LLLMGTAILIAVLFMIDWKVVAWVAVAYFAWRYHQRSRVRGKLTEGIMKLQSLRDRVQRLRDEIASGTYDSTEIQRHFRKCDDEGFQFHTLVYALLQLPIDKSRI